MKTILQSQINNSFTFHRYFYDAIKDLPVELQIEVYSAIMEYTLNDNKVELSPTAQSIFNLLKMRIDKDKARAANGRKGGRPTKNKAKKPAKKGATPKLIEPAERIDYNKLIEYFNNKTKGIFGTVKLPISSKRKGMINGRIREHGKKSFVEVIDMAMRSDFLKGQSGKFILTFDWMIRPINFEKILTGNYENNKGFSASKDSELAEGIAAGIARGSTPQEY